MRSQLMLTGGTLVVALKTEFTAPNRMGKLAKVKFVIFRIKVSPTSRPNSHNVPSVTIPYTGKAGSLFIFCAATNSAKHCPQPCSKSFFLRFYQDYQRCANNEFAQFRFCRNEIIRCSAQCLIIDYGFLDPESVMISVPFIDLS